MTFVQFFDGYLRDTLEDKTLARKYFPLIVGMFCIIFFGNMLGLLIDWAGMSIS
jgi:F0F1-type ATP synthase membrane subunit a